MIDRAIGPTLAPDKLTVECGDTAKAVPGTYLRIAKAGESRSRKTLEKCFQKGYSTRGASATTARSAA